MKVSVWVTVSDLLPTRQTLFEKVIDVFDNKQTMFQQVPHDEIFQSLKQAGVDGIELLIPLYASDKNIADVQDIIRKNNIPVLSIHQSLSNKYTISFAEIERLCIIANEFFASVVVLHSEALGIRLLDRDFITNLKNLQRKHHVTFGIENMDKFLLPVKSFMYKGNKFSSVIHIAGLSMTFDTTHLAHTGGDIIEFYMKNKDKIINIHISDYKRTWSNTRLLLPDHTHMPLGKGELPIENFLKTLRKERYKGFITMEINANLSGLCESAKAIREYIA